MGLFDSVYVPCPNCRKVVEFQTKADIFPEFNRYTLQDAPTPLAIAILNRPEFCESCNQWFALFDPAFPINPPRPSPLVVKLVAPENPDIHPQGMKWWPSSEPFGYENIDPSEIAAKKLLGVSE